MSSLSRFARRNPRWEEDGPAARREYQRRRAREIAAFLASLVAATGAGCVLALRLGISVVGRG